MVCCALAPGWEVELRFTTLSSVYFCCRRSIFSADFLRIVRPHSKKMSHISGFVQYTSIER